jgi:hypothetical protein
MTNKPNDAKCYALDAASRGRDERDLRGGGKVVAYLILVIEDLQLDS